jgi:lipopolysaccharide transport system permease protein
MVLYPLLFLGAYAIVYQFIFRVQNATFGTGAEYVLFIFCGLVPFLGFAESVAGGVTAVTGNANLIKNTLFPIELLPVKSVLVAQGSQLVGMGLLIAVLAVMGRLTPWALLIPLIWFFQLLLTIGIVWILSSSAVILRDLQHAVSVLMLVLMMVSPIAYTTEMAPAALRPFLTLNPLYPIITASQDVLFFGHVPRGATLIVLAGLSLLVFCAGYWYFCRLKQVFAENV